MLKAASLGPPGGLILREVRARGWTREEDWAVCPSLPQIVYGEQRVTDEIAQQLATLFGTSARLWMDLQSNYDEAKEGVDKRN